MILVINKIDCAPYFSAQTFETVGNSFMRHVQTCAVTGKGIPELERAVLDVRGLDPIPAGGRRWTVNQVVIHGIHLCTVVSLKRFSVC